MDFKGRAILGMLGGKKAFKEIQLHKSFGFTTTKIYLVLSSQIRFSPFLFSHFLSFVIRSIVSLLFLHILQFLWSYLNQEVIFFLYSSLLSLRFTHQITFLVLFFKKQPLHVRI